MVGAENSLRLILGTKGLNLPLANYVISGLNIYELGGSRVIVLYT